MRTQVDVVRPQPQRRPHYNLIEDRCRSVDDQVATTRPPHDAEQIPRVDLCDGDGAALTEEPARALGIAVAAPNRMPLFLEELCEKRAGRAGSQNEDLHDVAKTVSQTFGLPAD